MLWWLHPRIHHSRLYFFSDRWKWGRKEPLEMTSGDAPLLWWERRLPVFTLPHLTFMLNASSGRRTIAPKCSQNYPKKFGFVPVLHRDHTHWWWWWWWWCCRISSLLSWRLKSTNSGWPKHSMGGLERSGERRVEEYKHSRVQKTEGYFHNGNIDPQDGGGFSCAKNTARNCKYVAHGDSADVNRAMMRRIIYVNGA